MVTEKVTEKVTERTAPGGSVAGAFALDGRRLVFAAEWRERPC